MDYETKKRARELIRAADYVVDTIYRVFKPLEGEEDVEILFTGHESGKKLPDEPLTAYVRDGVAVIAAGW